MGPYAMTLAGLDPSSGAGLTADIKTFEASGVYGFGVCTAWTVQTDDTFQRVTWFRATDILDQALALLRKFPVRYCKIGLIESPAVLQMILPALRAEQPSLQFVLDPVLRASAGFSFHENAAAWESVLPELLLLTPNYNEAILLGGDGNGEKAAANLARHCAVLLKGGHHPENPGRDTLFHGNGHTHFPPAAQATPKHGSGCVLSAAITAGLALGKSLPDACAYGKEYTLQFLQSDASLLGFHRTVGQRMKAGNCQILDKNGETFTH
ncbi:hydroxymethylpyrimidine/phosphomethylpyrimidine kinase [Chitinophaga lutea]